MKSGNSSFQISNRKTRNSGLGWRWFGLLALVVAFAALGWLIWRWLQPPPPLVGVVTLGAGPSLKGGYHEPFGVAADGDGNLYFSDGAAGCIYRFATKRAGGDPELTTIAEGLETPSALAMDGAGNLIVANTGAHTIVRIDPATKAVSLVAGVAGRSGASNGGANEARFNGPIGVAVGKDGSIFVADTYNDRIRVIAPNGQVRTVAGGNEPGFVDGNNVEAQFDTPCGIAVAADGALIVADTGNRRIRRVAPDGQVTTIAGMGEAGDGTLPEAAFNEPIAVATRDDHSFYVADAAGSIRVVRLKSNDKDQHLEKVELPAEQFNRPTGLAVLPGDELAIAESGSGLIRAMVPAKSKLGLQPNPQPMSLTADQLRAMVAPRWPFAPPEAKRDIAGTLGEVRGERLPDHDAWFHNGLDVPGAYGELARAVFTERVMRPLPVEGVGTLRERVRLPLFGYIHVRIGRDRNEQLLPNFADGAVSFRRDAQGQIIGVRLRRGTLIRTGDAIGALNRLNHVHLIAGLPGAEFNALAALRLPGLSDGVAPTIEGVTIADEQNQTIFDTAAKSNAKDTARPALNGRVRIFVRAYDQADGNAKYRRLGLYRVGYQVLTASASVLPSFDDTRRNIEFDRLPNDWRAVALAYAVGSQSGYEGATIFRYIVTNVVRGGEAREEFFDTSKLAPGDYTLRVIAADFFGNRTQRDLSFRVQNRER
jgi:sugar lactone lactonase YvrE